MLFRDFLQNTAKEINKELELFFHGWSKDIEHISSRLFPYTNALADACRGGKRIRGALVKLGYEMARAQREFKPHPDRSCQAGELMAFTHSAPLLRGEGNEKDILKVAVAYEIFQAAILVHDDIIDKSLLRRGKPSLYAGLGGDHNGKSLAICLGDIGFFLAFQLIADSGFPEKEKNKALSIFSKTMLETGIGELWDVELATGEKDATTVLDIIRVYEFKTAYYTITAPLLLGGVLGGLSDSALSAIRIFGQNLGIAFQIQDDINDIFYNESRLGKEIGGDIKEGKKTLLYMYAKERASKKQEQLLNKFYGNSTIGSGEIEVVKNVLVETGALKYAQAEAKRYSQRAKRSIFEITQNERFVEMLREMVEYFVRKKN